jgi:hypothetical protein
MNNSVPLSSGNIATLCSVYAGTMLMFYITYKGIYALYEAKLKKQQSNQEKSVSQCLLEYEQWTLQKKADFISRITSQIHALVAICFSVKALFFTWYHILALLLF